ncbi:S9 family peptidase [bacterium]|nr:MAG: S9 family peptidase [bacterium]
MHFHRQPSRLLSLKNRQFRRARLALGAVLFMSLSSTPSFAQAPVANGYRTPPAPIPQILDAAPTPGLSISPDRITMALLGRESMLSIERLAEPELRLAGARINPRTTGPSRERFSNRITLQPVAGGPKREVLLPTGAQLSYFDWSPDSSRLAFANTVENGIELYVLDVRTAQAQRILGAELCATTGTPFRWSPDSRSLIIKRIPTNRGAQPALPKAPSGPIIQENSGRVAPARTYQDLLADAYDEQLFEYYSTSQISRVPAQGGTVEAIGEPGIYTDISISPNAQYLIVTRLKKPFSYLAPASAFAYETAVLNMRGSRVYSVHERKEVVLSPIGRDMVTTEPRGVQWRADAPATLVWAVAVDAGNAKQAAPVRDRVYVLDAPFTAQPRTLIDLDQRFAGITWGSADKALVQSRWSTTERAKTYVLNPAKPSESYLLWDRAAEDRYSNPGAPLTEANGTGQRLLRFAPGGNAIFLSGEGASPKGNYPFLDKLELRKGELAGKPERLWQAADPYFETITALLDENGHRFITRRESPIDAPNYFLRDAKVGSARPLTEFTDPAPQLAGIQRQIITYPRADGVVLSATLYTPPGYDAKRDGPLPMLMWAYPREFRDADAASQITDSPNRFSRPDGSSHLFLLTQGYAILDGPAMPIIGVGDVEPNDTYIEQLVSSAKAAVDKVVDMGVADRDRIGVGGHSYGAFMTANLLAHSDLFRTGIARSGAYNRTLTPFGFQSESRTFWEAQNIYNQMSPFNFAQRINEPLLLIHGVADNNSGTFPIQSERMYQALQGQGATAKLVLLPHESHGYSAKESIQHVLAEMIEWMDRYVKNAPPRATAAK